MANFKCAATYEDLSKWLGKRDSKILANNTTVERSRYYHNRALIVRLHGHKIAELTKDTIVISHGGVCGSDGSLPSKTTKQRLNQILSDNDKGCLSSHDGDAYYGDVRLDGEITISRVEERKRARQNRIDSNRLERGGWLRVVRDVETKGDVNDSIDDVIATQQDLLLSRLERRIGINAPYGVRLGQENSKRYVMMIGGYELNRITNDITFTFTLDGIRTLYTVTINAFTMVREISDWNMSIPAYIFEKLHDLT